MNRTYSFVFAALAVVCGLTLLPAALSAQKALVYCPVGVDATGCNNVVNALTSGGGFPDGVQRAYNGTEGTLDLATADLSGYAVLVVPSLSDNGSKQPYGLLRSSEIAAKLSGVFTGRVAVWSGTPDQGKANREAKNTLIRNLTAHAAGDHATSGVPGMLVLQDASAGMTDRYNWLASISGRAISADPTTKAFGKVRSLTENGTRAVGGISFGNMASFGLVLPTGSDWTADVSGDEALAFGAMTGTGAFGVVMFEVGARLKALWAGMFSSGTTVLATSEGKGNTKLGSATLGGQSPAQINPGQTAGYDVTATRCTNGGCNGNADVTFTFVPGSNWPAGASVNWPLVGGVPTTTAKFGSKNNSVRVTLTVSTTSAVSSGTYAFTVRVEQGNAKADVPGTLVVVAPTPGNQNPTIQNPGDRNNAEGDVVSLQVSASDADGDALTYGASGLPAGLSINTSTGLISGTVDWLDGASPSHTVTVSVSDGKGGNASAAFTWTISNTNRTPTITRENGSVTVMEGQTATNSGTYNDLDTGDNVAITASIGSVTKTGTNSGTWSWSYPTTAAAATQTVTITANDGKGGTASTTFSLDVTARPTTTVSVSSATATYGDNSVTLNATVTAGSTVVNEGTVTFTVTGSPVVGSATSGTVSNGAASVSYVLPAGTAARDYTITAEYSGSSNFSGNSGTGTLTVAKADQVISWSNPAAITFGTALSGTQLNATALDGAVLSYSPAAGTVLDAGNGQTLRVDAAETSNYKAASKTVTVDVAKADPVISWSDPAPIAYGTTLAGVLNASLTTGDGALSYNKAATDVLGAGTHTLTVTAAETPNFNEATKSVSLVVNKAQVALSASGTTFTYDGSAQGPSFTGDVSQVDINYTGTGSYNSATAPTNAGSYSWAATLKDATNTEFASTATQSGSFTIDPAPVSLPISGTTKTYTGDPQGATVTPSVTGFTAYTVTYTGIDGTTYPASTTAPTNAGKYSVVVAVTDANYTISGASSGTLTIGKADQVIDWSDPTAITQGTPLSGTQLNARVTTGDGALTYSPIAGTVLNVGAHTLTANAAGTNNYKAATKSVSITVTNVAPVVTITGPTSGAVFAKDAQVTFTGTFTDPGATDTHTYEWVFKSRDHGFKVSTPVLAAGARSITSTFPFPNAGVYNVTLTVRDNNDGVGTATTVNNDVDAPATVVIYDPSGGFVTGGGWINSPAGASVSFPDAVGRANFGFVSKYEKGAKIPSGQTQFQFKAGNLNFHSTVYEWLTVSGARAQYKGEGTINGGSTVYGFMLTAVDGQINGGGNKDKFRIKIWDKASGNVVYDNQIGTGDDAELSESTVIAGGSIVIHSK
jgi:hypothetical protein